MATFYHSSFLSFEIIKEIEESGFFQALFPKHPLVKLTELTLMWKNGGNRIFQDLKQQTPNRVPPVSPRSL
jgi:hypothetical protein